MGRTGITILQIFTAVSLLCLVHLLRADEDVTVEIVGPESESESETWNSEPEEPRKLSSIDKYRLRFSQYRGMQENVMNTIYKKVEKEQLANLITGMVTNLFKFMLEAKANLTRVGYVAGDEFPTDLETQDSLSKVLENTFMFADTLLRRPKRVHKVYDEQQEWRDALNYAYHVCSRSGVFNNAEQQYLDLMAKEAGILPKDDNFVNPYLDDSEKPRKRFEDPKPPEKKKPKKPKRGPKLSHTEL